jgi:hypothetical protein
MRIVGLILIAAAAVSLAQPRVVNIHLNNGTIDSVSCSRIDTASGVRFHDNHMIVPLAQTLVLMAADSSDSIVRVPTGDSMSICVAQIDSITLDFVGGPTYKITQPMTSAQIFHVGDSVTVKWNYNPIPAGQKAYFQMSTDNGKTWQFLTNLVCYMMWKDSSVSGTTCAQGSPYSQWPYVRTPAGLVGTWKFKISNPMVMPDAMVTPFNPISDSVLIKIHDYDNNEQSISAIFKIR